MKILIISPNPIFGGAATANMAIADVLAKENNVVYNDEYLCKFKLSSDKLNYDVDNFAIHKNRYKFNLKFINHVNKLEPDIIIWGNYMVSLYYIFSIIYFRLFRKSRQCYIFHSTSLVKNIKGMFIDIIASFISIFMNKLVFVSQYTKETWSDFFCIKLNKKNKFCVIHNPISIEEETIKEILQAYTCISFIGRLSVEKQPDLFCKLASNNTKISRKYFIWGDGPLSSILKNKYSNFVSFMGFVSNIDEIYNNTDILVLTSKFENCPMVILEAKKRGIPCIAPNVGGISEIVDNKLDGILYDEFSILEIQNYLDEITKNYISYSDNCIYKSKKFDYQSTYNKWNNLILEN